MFHNKTFVLGLILRVYCTHLIWYATNSRRASQMRPHFHWTRRWYFFILIFQFDISSSRYFNWTSLYLYFHFEVLDSNPRISVELSSTKNELKTLSLIVKIVKKNHSLNNILIGFIGLFSETVTILQMHNKIKLCKGNVQMQGPFINSRLLRCCTARGFSTGFSLAIPTCWQPSDIWYLIY